MAKNALGYKTNQSRTYGLATVTVGKNKVKVVFEASGDSYSFALEDMPSKPKLAPQSEDTYMVVLTPEKDGVEKLGPAEGHFKAVCVDFQRPEEDADPEPVEVTADFHGKETVYQRFTAFFEITAGRYKGLQVPHFLRYKFSVDGDGNAMWDGDPSNPKAIHLPRLVEFCEKTGCVEQPIEWPEDGNILPELLRRIQKANKTVDLVIKKGYIDSILASDYEDAEEEDAPVSNKKVAAAVAPAKKSNGKAHKEVDPDEDL